MFRRFWKVPDRREHPRVEASLEVSIQVEMYGFEENSRPFFASGRTVNVSRGGVFANVDAPVAEGSVCKLFFRDGEGQVRPTHMAGRVLRCTEENGDFQIAIEFDEPLLEINAALSGMAVEGAC